MNECVLYIVISQLPKMLGPTKPVDVKPYEMTHQDYT